MTQAPEKGTPTSSLPFPGQSFCSPWSGCIHAHMWYLCPRVKKLETQQLEHSGKHLRFGGNSTAQHTEHWSSVHHGKQVVLPHPGGPHLPGDAAAADPGLCAGRPGQRHRPVWFLLSHEDLEAEYYLPFQLGCGRLPSHDRSPLSSSNSSMWQVLLIPTGVFREVSNLSLITQLIIGRAKIRT